MCLSSWKKQTNKQQTNKKNLKKLYYQPRIINHILSLVDHYILTSRVIAEKSDIKVGMVCKRDFTDSSLTTKPWHRDGVDFLNVSFLQFYGPFFFVAHPWKYPGSKGLIMRNGWLSSYLSGSSLGYTWIFTFCQCHIQSYFGALVLFVRLDIGMQADVTSALLGDLATLWQMDRSASPIC